MTQVAATLAPGVNRLLPTEEDNGWTQSHCLPDKKFLDTKFPTSEIRLLKSCQTCSMNNGNFLCTEFSHIKSSHFTSSFLRYLNRSLIHLKSFKIINHFLMEQLCLNCRLCNTHHCRAIYQTRLVPGLPTFNF